MGAGVSQSGVVWVSDARTPHVSGLPLALCTGGLQRPCVPGGVATHTASGHHNRGASSCCIAGRAV